MSEAEVQEVARVIANGCGGDGYWELANATKRQGFMASARAVLKLIATEREAQ